MAGLTGSNVILLQYPIIKCEGITSYVYTCVLPQDAYLHPGLRPDPEAIVINEEFSKLHVSKITGCI